MPSEKPKLKLMAVAPAIVARFATAYPTVGIKEDLSTALFQVLP